MLKSILFSLFIYITIFNYTVSSMEEEQKNESNLFLLHGRFTEGNPEELIPIPRYKLTDDFLF